MTKYRKLSPFNGANKDFVKNTIIQQAIREFDIYQQYAPNSHSVYINDNNKPIKATMIDVTDLQSGSDSKWMLVPLNSPVDLGDIVTWDNKKWIIIYDKEKNTRTCFKVKIIQCNTEIKIPYYEANNLKIHNMPVYIRSFMSDIKNGETPLPVEKDTMYVSCKYDEFSKSLLRQDRLFIYGSAWEIVGIDYTNIDYYISKGILKFTVKSSQIKEDFDNLELEVCDYYKKIDRVVNNPSPVTQSSAVVLQSEKKIYTSRSTTVKANTNPAGGSVLFSFEGDSLGCTLTDVTFSSCVLKTSDKVGIVNIKATLLNDPTKFSIIRIEVTNGW